MRTLIVLAMVLGSFQPVRACPMPTSAQQDMCPDHLQLVGDGLVELESVSELGIYRAHHEPALIYHDPCCNRYRVVPKLRQPMLEQVTAAPAQQYDEQSPVFSDCDPRLYRYFGEPGSLHRKLLFAWGVLFGWAMIYGVYRRRIY